MYLKTGPKTYELFKMLNTRVFLFFFLYVMNYVVKIKIIEINEMVSVLLTF